MRYLVKTTLAMALFAFCWVAIGYSINQLLQVGTCASGGPYVSARECPPGIERLMFSMIGAIFLIFVAAGIYLSRGVAPGSAKGRPNANVILWFWTGLFWSLAVGCFLGVWGPEANPGPGGKEGGLIVGFMGLLMGAGGAWAAAAGWSGESRWRRRDPDKVRPVATKVANAATRIATGADPVDRLEKLDRLRRQGALTDAEFETLKARIVEGRR